MPDNIVTVDEDRIRDYIGELVRQSVEDTLNALLDEEADQIANAGRYERTDERQAYRSGHYTRRLQTTSGEVELSVPKLRGATFASKVIERYRRRETSVEEAMMEMYLAGVNTRRIRDVTEILWGSSVSAGTVSKLNRRAFGAIDEWRRRPLTCEYPYVFVDGTYVKRNWGGAYQGVAVLVAIGVRGDGYREVIGCEEGYTESAESWRSFLLGLRGRGLSGVRMVTGDKSEGMLGALAEVFPGAMYQRCTVHFYRNVLAKVPQRRRAEVAAALRAIHEQESRAKSLAKARAVAAELRASKLEAAARAVESGAAETLTYALFPREHWRRIRTNNGIERLNREIKRRTKAIGTFPAGDAAVMLAAARCKYVADGNWGSRRYLDMGRLDGWDERAVLAEQDGEASMER